MKINFERIEIFQDIGHTLCTVADVKKDFANIIYNNGAGLSCHALAIKIYNSTGDTEYTDEECELIRKYSQLCNPAFIDAVNRLFNSKK